MQDAPPRTYELDLQGDGGQRGVDPRDRASGAGDSDCHRNASFENPTTPGATYGTVDDWVLTGAGGGVWNLANNLGGCPGDCWIPPTAPDGDQIGWLSVGPAPGATASMSQVLSDSLIANQTYTLSGVYGHPLNFAVGTTFTGENVGRIHLIDLI